MFTSKRIIFIGIFLCVSFHLVAQPFNNAINSPSIPSAAAMNYGKQAEINTNFYTGAAGYSLPLCGISDATVSHGVSINYNSSFRVGEIASNVGLGFHLAAGGLVTRTILGVEDDNTSKKGFYHDGAMLSTNHFGEAADADRDSESDIYTFSAGAMVGKFIFDNNQNIVMLPQSDVKVTEILDTDNTFKGFTLQSPTDGMVYYFGYHPVTNANALEYATVNNEQQLTSWMLTRIESFDGHHALDFEYISHEYQFFSLPYCTRTGYKDNGSTQFTPNCSDNPIGTIINGQIIQKITSPTKNITFNHFTRQDLQTPFRFPKGINQIVINTGGSCYQYDLSQDYFKDPNDTRHGDERLRLTAVQKKACNTADSEPVFAFEYYGSNNQDGTPFYPHILDKNRDHWDFYNYRHDQTSPTNNNDFDNIIPSAFSLTTNGTISLNSDVNRKTYQNAQVIGALKKITLPTGGYTEIEYEANDYYKGVPTPLFSTPLETCDCSCGGIKKDDTQVLITQTLLETGTWTLCIDPFIDVPECTGYSTTNNNAKMVVYNSQGQIHATKSFDSPVAECMTGALDQLVHKVRGNLVVGETYKFEVESLNSRATLSLSYLTGGGNEDIGGLRVKKTTTYDGSVDGNNNEVHTNDIIRTYKYKNALDPTKSSGVLFNQPKYAFTLNDYSVLFTSSSTLPLSGFEGYHIGYKNTVIKENGNGSRQYQFFIEDSTDVYDDYPIAPEPIRVEAGVPSNQKVIHQNGTVENESQTIRYDQDDYSVVSGLTFKAQNVPTFNGSTLINDFTHHVFYDPRTSIFRAGTVISTQDSVSTTTEYQYHPTILAPNVITSTNSDGKPTLEVNFYTIDHLNTAFKDDFEETNRIALPLETRVFVNNEWLAGTKTDYAFFDANGKNPNENSSSNNTDVVRPYKTSRFETTWTNGNLEVEGWDIQQYFESYTDDGMLKSWRKNHWDDAEFYNYKNRLLTSKTYLTFKDSTEYYPNNSSLVKKVIDKDGTSSSITYDSLLRPKIITDDQKNIITTFDYHFTTGVGDKNYVKTTTNYPTPVTESTLDIIENYDYKDGLGRTIANLRKGQGPDSANDDIINAVAYDKQGRVFKTYEPQLLTSNNGAYQAPQGTWKFTETTFYPSPLNRNHTVTLPDWSTTTYEYGHNTTVDEIAIDSTSTLYADKELLKQTVIDGNTNKFIVFTDKKGRTIVSRRTDNIESTGLNYDTKYIYDDKDRRVYSLPPSTDISQKDLLFFCEYDQEDRKIREYHPGKAEMEYVYNLQDLLIGRRDGYLKERGLWYSYQYDIYGRELKSGFNNQTILNTNTPLGIAPTESLIETVYGTATHELDKVKTIKTKILDGGNNWLESTNTYSISALLINRTSNNHRNLIPNVEMTSILYDGADNPLMTTYNHKAFGNDFNIATNETIDYAGRARESKFQANGSQTYTINSKFYDEEEQLIRKLQGKTGFGGGQAWLQQCDYSYLENGLLHQINGDNLTGTQRALSDCPNALPNPGLPNLTNLDNKDLFYLELAYQTPFASTSAMAQNNGNITGVKWQVRGREKQGFSLQYDIYNRLTNADYFDEDSGSILTETGIYDVDMTYDQRGNIQTLSRYGLNQTKDCYESVLIDQLNYSYRDSNQLKMVTDNAPCPDSLFISKPLDNQHLYAVSRTIQADNVVNAYADVTYQGDTSITLLTGFHAKAGTDFTARIDGCPTIGFETGGYTQRNEDSSRYDINGNLMLYPQKGLRTYFNHLDLADSIVFETGNSIHFTYDAIGTLLVKKLRDFSGQILEIRDYIGGVEYVNNTLESIYHAEGRLHYINGSSQMEYTIVDHLGNTRLSYTDLNGNGIIETPNEILDEVHYYPNGLKLEGYWMNSDKFRYTFNSIEEINDFGLNVNRATFRTLDPELGRWWSVDPQATVLMGLSPYNSMNNSPIVFNDPNGDVAPLIWIGAAVIGGGINVATHWDDITKNGFNLGTAATAFGIGAAGGAIAAVTGGVATTGLGLGSTGALAGLVGGIAGEAVGGPVAGALNGVVFGDSYTQADWVQGMIWGGVFGAGLGAWDAARKGLDPWLGDFTPKGNAPKLTTGSSVVDNIANKPYTDPDYMWSETYTKGTPAGPKVVVRATGSGGGGIPLNVHLGKQGKHIIGHNNYISGKSILNSNPQELLDGFHNGNFTTLRSMNNKTFVDFGRDIGIYYQGGNPIGPTRFGVIHYGNSGAHIVPANPIQY